MTDSHPAADDDGPVTPQEQVVSDYLDTLNAGTPATHAEMLARFPTLTPDERESARHGMEATDWFIDLARRAGLRRDVLDEPEGECCPDCGGEGAVLSDRPGYLQVCPTCHGEGEVYDDAEPDSAPDTEHDEACPCERCRDEREYIGELADRGLIP